MDVHMDHRGWFCEGYNKKSFHQLQIRDEFVQDNYSYTQKSGTIRGMHYQAEPYAQSKLFRCITGAVYDVVVDLRPDSPTYRKWKGYQLRGDHFEWLYIPPGFAHGFQSIQDNCLVQYKVNQYFSPEHDRGIRWSDKQINIAWPISNPILSDKDRFAPLWNDIKG